MKLASQELSTEHKTILLAIKVVEKICTILRADGEIDVRDAQNIIDFIRIFADKFHHGKEEGLYFPAMVEAGFSNEFGPVAVMLSEHVEGRSYVSMMQEAISGDVLDKQKYAKGASSYAFLLTSHIDKEDNILYPMGDGRLTAQQNNELLEKFKHFEEQVIGKDKYQYYFDLVASLQTKYLS
ncbi:MAG: hemerythrin domain-containing protein [Candidatus Kapabacteria bacterium]|nr:hemerythrin domain-containing protein [Candidatus Kapabacteria bacterium]